MAIAGRAVDGDAAVLKRFAEGVDIVDGEGEVAEIAAAIIGFTIPVVGQFQRRPFAVAGFSFVLGRGEKDRSFIKICFSPVAFSQKTR